MSPGTPGIPGKPGGAPGSNLSARKATSVSKSSLAIRSSKLSKSLTLSATALRKSFPPTGSSSNALYLGFCSR